MQNATRWSRLSRCCAGLLAAAGLMAAVPAHAGQWLSSSYTNIYGGRFYNVYVPTNYRAGTAVPMMVMLHGCLQNPDTFAGSTRMNQIAEANNFIVVYPNQALAYNPTQCWNWMYPVNQARGTGEPSIIMGIINAVKTNYTIDARRIYVAGISAGGGMTSTMLSCYPDVFAAGAVHAGLMYQAATTLTGGTYAMTWTSPYSANSAGKSAWQCGGSQRKQVGLLVFHGTSDITVNPGNGSEVVEQFAQTNDFADDGVDNNSVKYTYTRRDSASVAGGRSYTVDVYNYGGRDLIKHYKINGMGHAWSGGNGSYSFTDGSGPNSSQIMWDFFKNFTR